MVANLDYAKTSALVVLSQPLSQLQHVNLQNVLVAALVKEFVLSKVSLMKPNALKIKVPGVKKK